MVQSEGVPTYGFQWNQDGSPIAGATAQTYTPVSDGPLYVTVTATNSIGSTAATSQTVAVTS
jgi:hypothetical protein